MGKTSRKRTMGCCGCSLSTSTVTAACFGLVESLVGMAWSIFLVVLVETHDESSEEIEEVTSTNATESFADFLRTDEGLNSSLTDWELFKDTVISPQAREQAHVFELSIAAIVLNSFWLVTTLSLAIGNSEKCRNMMKPWVVTTIIITITDIAATVYFIFKAVKDTDGSFARVDRLFVENIFVILATFFSRGGPIVWMANIALCIFVAQRIKKIEVMKSKRLPFDTDMRPYSLTSPYEGYGPENYRYENMRPSTPPPDYEARRKARDNKANQRLSPECETVPVSLRSSSSLAKAARPSSRIYDQADERVEFHHGPSDHHNHHLHAYDNKALEAEPSEVWLGIPRPTLKSNRSSTIKPNE